MLKYFHITNSFACGEHGPQYYMAGFSYVLFVLNFCITTFNCAHTREIFSMWLALIDQLQKSSVINRTYLGWVMNSFINVGTSFM